MSSQKINHFEFLKKLIVGDEKIGGVLLIWGESGSGKTSFMVRVCKDALKIGKKVLFFDVEGNIKPEDLAEMKKFDNFTYCLHITDINEIVRTIETDLKRDNYDLICFDSIGLAVMSTYVEEANKFQVFQRRANLMSLLTRYALLKGAIVIVSDQPTLEGELGKGRYTYYAKEKWFFKKISASPTATIISVLVTTSRRFGANTNLATIKIDNSGVHIAWKVKV